MSEETNPRRAAPGITTLIGTSFAGAFIALVLALPFSNINLGNNSDDEEVADEEVAEEEVAEDDEGKDGEAEKKEAKAEGTFDCSTVKARKSEDGQIHWSPASVASKPEWPNQDTSVLKLGTCEFTPEIPAKAGPIKLSPVKKG